MNLIVDNVANIFCPHKILYFSKILNIFHKTVGNYINRNITNYLYREIFAFLFEALPITEQYRDIFSEFTYLLGVS